MNEWERGRVRAEGTQDGDGRRWRAPSPLIFSSLYHRNWEAVEAACSEESASLKGGPYLFSRGASFLGPSRLWLSGARAWSWTQPHTHLNTTGGTGFSREVPVLNLTSHRLNHDMVNHVFQFRTQKPGWPWTGGGGRGPRWKWKQRPSWHVRPHPLEVQASLSDLLPPLVMVLQFLSTASMP